MADVLGGRIQAMIRRGERVICSYERLCEVELFNLDMSDADFEHANLTHARFAHISLRRARLQYTRFVRAILTEVDFTEANLYRAILHNAKCSRFPMMQQADCYQFPGTKFCCADLRESDLTFAWLGCADFRGADLAGADITAANLENSVLIDTDFRVVGVHGASIHGARYSATTKWPEGFDPTVAGAILVDP